MILTGIMEDEGADLVMMMMMMIALIMIFDYDDYFHLIVLLINFHCNYIHSALS